MLRTVTRLGSIPRSAANTLRAASAASESVTLGKVADGVGVGGMAVGLGRVAVGVGGAVVRVGVGVTLLARMEGTSQKALARLGRLFARTPRTMRTL